MKKGTTGEVPAGCGPGVGARIKWSTVCICFKHQHTPQSQHLRAALLLPPPRPRLRPPACPSFLLPSAFECCV